MLTQSLPLVIPPAPKVHAKDLPAWRHLLLAQRNSIGIFPDYAFDVPFARRTLLGVHAVLINDPEGIRHVMATNAYNYVRPKPKRTSLWPPYYADTESFALTRARCFPSHALPSSRASGRCSGWSGSNHEFHGCELRLSRCDRMRTSGARERSQLRVTNGCAEKDA